MNWDEREQMMLRWFRRECEHGLVGTWGDEHSKHATPHSYEPTGSYQIAADWLAGDPSTIVADWGCGAGGAQPYFAAGCYLGIDGTSSRWADVVADLRTCNIVTTHLLTRHTLEHNFRWREVLANMLTGFKHRAAIITFIPPSDRGDRIWRWDDPLVPYIEMNKQDFMARVSPLLVKTEHLQTGDVQEDVWCLERKS